MGKSSPRSELQRDISRIYQSGPPTIYDKCLSDMRMKGPQFNKQDHKFHKCYSDKQEKLLTTNQKERGDHIRSWSLQVGK